MSSASYIRNLRDGFGSTIRHIVARGEWHLRRIVLTGVVCLIWALATVNLGIYWNSLYTTYVAHSQTQDSLLRYIYETDLNIVVRTTVAVNAMLAELMNTWRCWELYQRRWIIVVLPLLGVIAGLISHAFVLVTLFPVEGSPATTANWAQIDWTIVYYGITASINILTTSLIIIRILCVGGFKHARTYRGIIEIMVESAVLYSGIYIVYFSLYVGSDGYAFFYVEGLVNAVTAVAPTMIIGSAMAGDTRPDDEWKGSESMPDIQTVDGGNLRFASMAQTTTQSEAVELPTSLRSTQ
ncbi:hypothetical protein CPB85DRAFT_1312529 [Mucidula mucida]|nr:hypothetical protein CPB85DRAFT_1312529 [Mucidula mucida]